MKIRPEDHKTIYIDYLAGVDLRDIADAYDVSLGRIQQIIRQQPSMQPRKRKKKTKDE